MRHFSLYRDREGIIGELILEALLSSNIDNITYLNFIDNPSWFKHPDTEEDR